MNHIRVELKLLTKISYFPGNNLLFVAVYGPKGPCDEVFMKHLGHNNYQVNYAVRDRGDYVIVIKWGEDHIPGSPFKVDVL
jgi:filamin